MSNRLEISQIFIPNTKQATNFVAIYEEMINPHEPVHLFLVMEIKGERKSPASKKQAEFQKIAQTIAHNLKHAYLSEPRPTELTFEKALTIINSKLSGLAEKGMVDWYKKLDALIGVFAKNGLSLSSTGSASAMLLRGKEFANISDDVSPGQSAHPLKTFTNFAYGALTEKDIVVFSTANLYNYISLEKLRVHLNKQSLYEASRDMVSTLKQDASETDAFAAFVFKVRSSLALSDEELHPLISPSSHTIIEDDDKQAFVTSTRQRVWKTLVYLGGAIWQFFIWLVKKTYAAGKALFFRLAATGQARREGPRESAFAREPAVPKAGKKTARSAKTFFLIFAFLAFLLVINLIFFNFRNSQQQTKTSLQRLITQLNQDVNTAEASLIYGDEDHAAQSAVETRKKLEAENTSAFFPEETKQLQARIAKLLDQVNKVRDIAEVEPVAQFTNTPDQLVKTPDGFLGFNSMADSFEFARLSSSAVDKTVLSSPIPENLIGGAYVPGLGPVFLSSSGTAWKLDVSSSTASLAPVSPLSNSTTTDQLGLAGFKFYSNRLYTADRHGSQIFRLNQKGNSYTELSPWLKEPADFSGAVDLAVDGNVYVLSADSLEKFTSGKVQTFGLPTLSEPVKNATRIITDTSFQYIYVLEPAKSRIVILTKQGKLAVQLKSGKFDDAKDIWADEGNKTLYLLNGNALFKFKY